MSAAIEFLGPESPLRGELPSYVPRHQQLLMAEAVSESLARRETLVIEAGTGTGKTFAYLIPALTSGLKTIVSTGTRALQDQLYHRDIPVLTAALGRPVTIALLKGRSNYLCLHRLAQARQKDDSHRYAKELTRIERWAALTRVGDKREVTDVAETSGVWSEVTSTVDNCLGQNCEFYEKCLVAKARRRAQSADVVVVNHHLLLADLAMKESGFDQFLPGASAFVIDEAHQLPDIAGHFFGIAFGTRALKSLLDDARVETTSVGGPGVTRCIDAVETCILKLRDAAPHAPGRYEFATLEAELESVLSQLRDALASLYEQIQPISELSPALDILALRLYERMSELARYCDQDGFEGLRWIDVSRQSLSLNLTPLDTSAILGNMIAARDAGWIFTSATLAVGEDFSHFTDRTGLANARCIKLTSPYDLAGRSMLYLPPNMPPPSDRDYTEAVMQAAMPVLKHTIGGVFILFTSHRALKLAAEWALANKSKTGRRELLVQGDAPRDDILNRFRANGKALLLATGTFWEGVDVRGQALTVVVIDKLPFTSPSDPLLMARLSYLKKRGENGFVQHQLPQAVLSLKQGVGRLLRDETDYGVVILCDPRLSQKSYGRQFLEALAPMPVTTRSSDIRKFFSQMEPQSA